MSSSTCFGATVADVLRRLPGAVASDFAHRTVTIRSGSSADDLQLDSTEGFAAGDSIHINTGAFSAQGETRTVASIVSDTELTLSSGFSASPVSGDAVDDGPTVVQAALTGAAALVEASLPERYRRLLSRVEGEMLVADAQASQTTATLGLAGASGLVLYDDYTGPYADRSQLDAMSTGLYTLGGDRQTVTFSPALTEGTRIVADYDHDLSEGLAVLVALAADLAAARLAAFVLAHQPEWVQTLLDQAQARLVALADGSFGVPELDALRLYDDWERTLRGTRVGTIERV